MGYGGMNGIPMVASSPVRHDSPLNMHGLEVTAYQPPWKALSDFALHADLDNNGSVNTHTPAFQHLVNQVSWSDDMLEIDVEQWKLMEPFLLITDARLRYECRRRRNATPVADTTTPNAAHGRRWTSSPAG